MCVLPIICGMTEFGTKWLSGPADFNTITTGLPGQHFEILFSLECSSGVELLCYSLILFSLRPKCDECTLKWGQGREQ